MSTRGRLTVFIIGVIAVLAVTGGWKYYQLKNRPPKPALLYQLSSGRPWGKLLTPQQALSYKNRLYISDTGNGRVLAFDLNGKFLFEFAKPQGFGKKMPYPYGIAADGKGNIYVADTEAGKLMVYDEQGHFLKTLAGINRYLSKPTGVFIRGDRIYVSDVKLQQVRVFHGDAKVLMTVGSGSTGKGEQDLFVPNTVIADSRGKLYVTDNMNNRIQVFGRDGKYMKTLGSGKGLELLNPRGVALDSRGYIYVANTLNRSIKIYNPAGRFLFDFTGNNSFSFGVPSSITIDRNDRIYVTDAGSVMVFSRT